MSQLVGNGGLSVLSENDRRHVPLRWRAAPRYAPTDHLWPRARILGSGWLESTWYEWPVLFSGTGQAVPFVYTLTPTVGGTAPSRPVYTLTLPATDYTIQQIYIVNSSQNPDQQITITRTFLPGDVIVIDCDSFSVTVNGAAADFDGQFPLLDPRLGTTNTISFYAVAADTPTLTPRIDWTSRYLS